MFIKWHALLGALYTNYLMHPSCLPSEVVPHICSDFPLYARPREKATECKTLYPGETKTVIYSLKMQISEKNSAIQEGEERNSHGFFMALGS